MKRDEKGSNLNHNEKESNLNHTGKELHKNEAVTGSERRNGLLIMGRLILLVKPLAKIMFLAIFFGTLGYLCAIFLTILATRFLLGDSLPFGITSAGHGALWIGAILVAMSVSRGLLHYAEQYCNHFIAFKLLALIRHEVFAALRRLCPAKLEGRDKGNLIAIITSDIELLEVFYAHTISPIVIAITTGCIMICYIGSFQLWAGIYALCAYVVVGALIPLWNGSRGSAYGMKFRNAFGEFSSFLLDTFRGLDETLQYGQGEEREKEMSKRSIRLGRLQKKLSSLEVSQRAITNMAIIFFSFGMTALAFYLEQKDIMSFNDAVTVSVAMMGSFGPMVALSSLSNNLNQTLASGERVLSILEETPMVEEIPLPEGTLAAEEITVSKGNPTAEEIPLPPGSPMAEEIPVSKELQPGLSVSAADITFSYGNENILKDYTFYAKPGVITGIHGPSGCGKSTLLKLIMRFWDVNKGEVRIGRENVREIPTSLLRQKESYVTQETYLFHDSIASNIAIGKPDASREEIIEAAKKASIHDFIMTLPDQYDTMVGELGDTLSGGECQRIGIARAFLHDAPVMLLDEPTSNLDSLNEGIILKSVKEEADTKTVILVSHRESTMKVADAVVEF